MSSSLWFPRWRQLKVSRTSLCKSWHHLPRTTSCSWLRWLCPSSSSWDCCVAASPNVWPESWKTGRARMPPIRPLLLHMSFPALAVLCTYTCEDFRSCQRTFCGLVSSLAHLNPNHKLLKCFSDRIKIVLGHYALIIYGFCFCFESGSLTSWL